jgi:hypothetical protein
MANASVTQNSTFPRHQAPPAGLIGPNWGVCKSRAMEYIGLMFVQVRRLLT